MAAKPLCKTEQCDKPTLARGLCALHYDRWRRSNLNFGPCTVPDCPNQSLTGRGFCRAHYLRWLRHGDPLGGRPTGQGEVQRWIEANKGHAGDECLAWPFGRKAKHGREGGYGILYFRGVGMHAARAMCILAHGEPPTPKHEAAHTCGKGHEGCVNPQHLRWATPLDNGADKVAHGTYVRGVDVNGAKLTEDQVREIRGLRGEESQRSIAARYGIHQAYVSQIQRRLRWEWLD